MTVSLRSVGLAACWSLTGAGMQAVAAEPAAAKPEVRRVLDVADVWAGHPVGFHLLSHAGRQFAAYYDAERRMTVATRGLDDDRWEYRVLPSTTGWDSHNYVTMAVDAEGHLHLSGNMHCHPLLYFRTTRPGDIQSFEQVPAMVGTNEKRCTYPRFTRGADSELIFHYRDGGSGNGNEIYNVYDVQTRTWRRLLDQPLTDGRGRMNAYAVGPRLGPDGWFHLAWLWRDTPSCDTNHTLSYARSQDLRAWETAAGAPAALPLTIENPGLAVDPTPPKGGMINMGVGIGFDGDKRPILTYHRYDASGYSQIYNARLEGVRWVIYQTSDWDWRWEFTGGGSVPCLVRGGSVTLDADGALLQSYSNAEKGSGTWILDPETLKPIGKRTPKPERPSELNRLESSFPGMQVRWVKETGTPDDDRTVRFLRWETLGTNRDRPRPEPWPEPSRLRLYEIALPE